MNNISIVGRVTKDITTQTTSSGIDYVRFNVAVTSDIKTADGERGVDFFSCVAWRETANNIAKYFKKGYPIGLTGAMNSRYYEKEDGSKQIVWELNVRNFYFVGSLSEETQETKPSKSKPKKESQAEMKLDPLDDDDGLPF
jgi:single-strand DNA-binding protein